MKPWLLAAVIAVVLVAACTPSAEGRGRKSKEALVDAYLVALEASDSQAMLALTNPRVEARAEVDDVIRMHGGQQLKNVTVSYLLDVDLGGSPIAATVNGTDASDGSPVELTIPIGRADDRYYLALGQAKPSGSEANPASPSAAAP